MGEFWLSLLFNLNLYTMDINGAASLIGTMINAAQTDYYNQVNYERFLENREYNEPVNQMNRLAEAGINLNAATGGVAQNATSNQSAPQAVAPQLDMSQLNAAEANSINRIAVEKENEVREALKGYYEAQTQGFVIENIAKPYILANTIRNLQLSGNIAQQSYDFAEKNNPILLQLNAANVTKVLSEAEYYSQEVENLKTEKEYVLQQIETSKSVESLNKVLASLNLELIETEDAKQENLGASTGLINQEKENAVEKHTQMTYETAKLRIENYFLKKQQQVRDYYGFTGAEQSLADQYNSIKSLKGRDHAEGFLRDQLRIVSENQSAVSSVLYHFSDYSGDWRDVENKVSRDNKDVYGKPKGIPKRTIAN